MEPAARIRCSSSERFIDSPALFGGKNASKWRGLSESRTLFAGLGDDGGDIRPGMTHDCAPLLVPSGHVIFPTRPPALQVIARNLEQLRISFDLMRDHRVHGQTACFQEPMHGIGGTRRPGPRDP